MFTRAWAILLGLGLITTGCGSYDSATSAAPPNYQPQPPPSENNNLEKDKYEAPSTNPFVVTRHDPLSTFAADVDTASYDIFRRDVNRGVLPHRDSVRLEEYINAFAYGYPTPAADAKHPFSITLRAARSPFHQTTLVAVGIKAKELAWAKRPANLVFLVDVSGSMSASNKLPLVKRVLLEALDVLDGETDTVSIVTYAGYTAVRLPPTPVSNRAQIESVVKRLGASGGTAGGAGIQLAYEQANAGFIPGGINHVLLCTDGDFNIGISNKDELVKLIEKERESGVTLTALGFGHGNLNDAMMEAVTNAGNGIYSVISDEKQAVSYARHKLLNTFNLVAKDVKIQVEFDPSKVYAYRLLGYENRALNDNQFRDDTVDAGEVGSSHTVTAIYELALSKNEIPSVKNAPPIVDGADADTPITLQANELCRVRIRYKEPTATKETLAREMDASLSDSNIVPIGNAHDDLQWALAIALLAEILKESPYARPDKIGVIENVLAQTAGDDADRKEAVELVGIARHWL
jgi:Ca-activated chloride channel family protein